MPPGVEWSAYTLIVETNVQCASARWSSASAHPVGRAGHVDDRVPLALERGPVGRRAVEDDVPRALRHRAGLAARRAGDVVAAGDGVGRDGVGEEQGAAENEQSHGSNLLPIRHQDKHRAPPALTP